MLQDLTHSLRQLMRRPIFTATAVLTLAIGMGVNAVAFSVVNGLLFKGFALREVPGTGRILTMPGGDEAGYASLPEYERFRDATRNGLDIAAEGRASLAWKHDGATETAWVLYVSRQYFSIVSPPIVAGRLQVARDGGTMSVAIGERFWRDKLGSRSLAGLTLRLNDTDVTVAGVIAESFTGPAGIYSPDVWLPLEDRALFGATAALRDPEARWLFVMGRLRDGATPAEVQGLVQTAVVQMAREWPDTHKGRGARFRTFDGDNSEVRGVTYGAAIGMGIIGLVLLLACFNVANLLLARAVERERDMGIRAALGARPVRLMRLVVIEGLVIAILSGALALLLAWWTQSLVTSFAIPIEEPQHIDMTPDATVALFIGALILVAGVLPGLWPAITAARIAGREQRRRQAVTHPSLAGRGTDRRFDHVSRRGGTVPAVVLRVDHLRRGIRARSPRPRRFLAGGQRLRHCALEAVCRRVRGPRAGAAWRDRCRGDRQRAILCRLRPDDNRVAARGGVRRRRRMSRV
jgi:hypothetical protein